MDRLQSMSVFVAVAEESGFASAARRLRLSPPSVTRAVTALETRLGCRLFHRTTRSVQLTEAGERYLEDCRRILMEIEEADRQASGVHAAPRGIVSVTGSVIFGRVILTPIVLDLLDCFPEITISTFFVDRVVHLMDEGIDVAVRIAELPDTSQSAVRVGSVRRVLCAAPAYLAARGWPRTPADLSDHETINMVNQTPSGDWAFRIFDSTLKIKPSSRLLVNTADAAIASAVAGRGITRVLSYMIAPHLEQGTLELVLEPYEPPAVPVHVVHKETGQTSAKVRAVVDFLVRRLRQEPVLAWPAGHIGGMTT